MVILTTIECFPTFSQKILSKRPSINHIQYYDALGYPLILNLYAKLDNIFLETLQQLINNINYLSICVDNNILMVFLLGGSEM